MGRGGRETLGGGYLLWALTATGCGENRQTACCPQQLGGGLRGHLKVQVPRVQGWAGSWGLLQEPTDEEQRAFTVSQPQGTLPTSGDRAWGVGQALEASGDCCRGQRWDSGPLTPGDSHHLRAHLHEQKGAPAPKTEKPAPKTEKPSPTQPCPTSQTPLTSKYPCSSEDSEAGLEMLEGCPPPPTLCTPAPSVSRSASGHPRLSAPSG